MEYLFKNRFSLFDSTIISVCIIMFLQQRWITTLIVFVVGTAISGFISMVMKNVARVRSMNRKWQCLAEIGDRVGAIKLHRQLFFTSLEQAKTIVDAHIKQQNP